MVEALTPERFYDSPGVGEWRVTANVASATFLTGSFSRGVDFVDVIGSLAEAANHHPDVDLRYSFVTIRLTTHDVHALSDLDVDLARHISEAARELGIVADANPPAA
ncbi:MAG: 4a-hydroxytetrahydrobiopterin dehydratase [Acidimicrobiales bacterium]